LFSPLIALNQKCSQVDRVTVTNQKSILTLNTGSATLKSAIYESEVQEDLLLSMTVDQLGAAAARLKITDARGTALFDSPIESASPVAALQAVFAWLGEHGYLAQLSAAGHRLVHGGPRFKKPQLVTPEFLAQIRKIVPLDPDHLPAAIQGIEFIAAKFPALPQVACFDTAFHATLPQVARMYALPRRLYDRGIVRYGFHGLSYEYVMRELSTLDASLANGRVVVAHLGSGASVAAIENGKSIDTSMGLTPLEGLVMATRSGDVDPGAVLYLLEDKEHKLSSKELDAILNKQSGLLGVSDISRDMRVLLDSMRTDPRAADAVNLFCYRAKKYIGAYAAALGGLDILVFAGGIGENAPAVRAQICDGLDFLGIRLDAARNQANADLISSPEASVKVRVIKTNEDLMIALHVAATLGWTKA
jgi:acetate kinase